MSQLLNDLVHFWEQLCLKLIFGWSISARVGHSQHSHITKGGSGREVNCDRQELLWATGWYHKLQCAGLIAPVYQIDGP